MELHKIVSGNKVILEVLPDKFFDWGVKGEMREAEKKYRDLLKEKFFWDSEKTGWGFINKETPKSYKKFIFKEREVIKNLIPKDTKKIIDVSAGVGNYSLYLARYFPYITHCEAEVGALNQAVKKAPKNVSFIRASYLQLPFKDNCFDIAICTDTLIRGKRHDTKLLREINRIAKIAIVDFHRNYFLKKKNLKVVSYNRNRIKKLIGNKKFYIQKIDYRPFFARRYLVVILCI